MIERKQIVDAARSYLGAPFVHQGRLREVGIDCAGLLTCVSYDVGLQDVRITEYSRQPDPRRFRELTNEYLRPVDFRSLGPGDILTFSILGAEQHYGLLTEVNPKRFIHAYESVGRCVEQELTLPWLRRIRGCYRFPEVAVWQS